MSKPAWDAESSSGTSGEAEYAALGRMRRVNCCHCGTGIASTRDECDRRSPPGEELAYATKVPMMRGVHIVEDGESLEHEVDEGYPH